MKTLDALLTRISNPYLAEPIPSKENMSLVYQSALRAPDHAWLRPWRFIEITGSSRSKLAKAFLKSAEKKSQETQVSEELKKKIALMPFRAPMIIVIIINKVERSNVPVIEQIQSTAAATQNMLLALHDMGFGAFWRTGNFVSYSNKFIADELSLPKESEVLGYLYVGTPNAKGKEIPKLKNEDFVTFWN
jgi:nitroreductase